MTAQQSDDVLYRGRRCTMAGVKGTGLFDPADQGIHVIAWSTSCWRGFACDYEIDDGRLLLTQLKLGLRATDLKSLERGEGPRLLGRTPEPRARSTEEIQQDRRPDPPRGDNPCRVVGLWEPVAFNGRMLLCTGFLQDMYVHMGFHPAFKYSQVDEVVFEMGRVVREVDRSRQMAELREGLSHKALEPGLNSTPAEIEAWIKKCFSLEFESFGD